ncbi:MAG: hypothetical protein IPF82_24055 [Blastocatellia bacterium]|nr:hypothetical protein [Blastocatellia bacterium]
MSPNRPQFLSFVAAAFAGGAILLGTPTIASCQFATGKGRLALGNLPQVQAVRPLSNDSIAVTIVRGKVEYASKLVTIDRRTGKQIEVRKVDGYPNDVQFVRITDADRIALLSSTRTEPAELSLYDIDRDGRIQLRAHTSLPISNPYGYVLSARAGAGFVLNFLPPDGVEVVAFSLGNGQILSRTNVGRTVARMLLIEGAATQLVIADYQALAVGFRFVDVTDPLHPADSGRIDNPIPQPGYTGVVTSAAMTSDGHYAVFTDTGFGLTVVDVNQRRIVGYVRTPFVPGIVQIRDHNGRLLVSMVHVGPVLSETDQFALFDLTDPGHPSLVAMRTTRDNVADLRFSRDGSQLVSIDTYGLVAYDAESLGDLWDIPLDEAQRLNPAALAILDGEVFAGWSGLEFPRFTIGSFAVPSIADVSAQGRDLVVRGRGFEGSCAIEIDGVAVRTRWSSSAADTLRFKHGLDTLTPGSTVSVDVRSEPGARSSRVDFVVPLSLER